ncbi:Hypoxanthine-guanine phosphoribosyltransferase [Clostridiaceae bacterium JG1575]|nr:Hypoxanthine-guanine phosphoribosyltransferase [Clostridiaceae bacterium JG1575]
MEDHKKRVLISTEDIAQEVARLGREIHDFYNGKPLYILALLRGSFIFCADLVRAIDLPCRIGFMTTASYGHAEHSSGNVEVVTDIPDNIEGAEVLVVDDIIDTGYTMRFVLQHVLNKGAASVRCCSLLDKPSRRKVDHLVPDFCGFTIEDVFVVGYGLNYGDYYRNVPYIFNFEELPEEI